MANSLIQSTINSVVDAVTGDTSHNNLQTFLNGISNAHSNGLKIKTPDPLNTFDVHFKFFPCKFQNPTAKKGILGSVADAATTAAKSAVKNTLNNMLGGLIGSMTNNINIKSEHDKFTTIASSGAECHSFLEYLAKANLLCGTEDTWLGGMGEITSPLEIDMTYFIQKMTIPNLKTTEQEIETGFFGKFSLPGLFVEPDTHNLILDVMNTRVPVLERIFYPWMKEVTLPYWSYATQPYSTATVTIDFTSHADVKYVFIGCRPSHIATYQPDQATPSDMTRQVTLTFDYMFINSDMTTTDSIKSKLGSLGKSLFNSAANSLKL